jgi:cytochrome c oxidase assembly factor CtaG
MKIRILTFVGVLVAPAVVLGHGGEVHESAGVWLLWEFDPLIVAILAVSAIVYSMGLRNLWRSAGVGHGISKSAAGLYALGWLSLAVALVSPVHRLGEVLFSMHMTQHEILMLVAAPLIVLGRPFVAATWAVPHGSRGTAGNLIRSRPVNGTWSVLSNGAVAWAVHAVALWVWHIPALFQATLTNDLVHTLQHSSFFGTAIIFWWAILFGKRGLQSYGAGVLYLFTTMVQSGLLGIIFTLSSHIWYPAYSATTGQYGLSPLEDQQIGGLVMWIPAGLVYMFAALVMFSGWLRESEKRVADRESRMRTQLATPR